MYVFAAALQLCLWYGRVAGHAGVNDQSTLSVVRRTPGLLPPAAAEEGRSLRRKYWHTVYEPHAYVYE